MTNFFNKEVHIYFSIKPMLTTVSRNDNPAVVIFRDRGALGMEQW